MLSLIATIDSTLSESGTDIKEGILECKAMVEKELMASYSEYTGNKESVEECKFEQLLKTLWVIPIEKGLKKRVIG